MSRSLGQRRPHETQLRCPDDDQAILLREVVGEAFHAETRRPSTASGNKSEQRSNKRHPLIWSGELIYGPSTWKVRVRNISETGALVESEKTLTEGNQVVLDLLEAGSINATVSWAVGDHTGLRFDESFDMRNLAKAKPRIAPTTWLRPSYLINEVAEESPWDVAWNRMSLDELREELEGYLRH